MLTEKYKRLADLVRQSQVTDYAADPATDAEIEASEQVLGCPFPESFKWFQKEFGAYSGFTDIYGIKPVAPPIGNIVAITMDERYECFPPMPAYLIPFSNTGGGDSYCFDTSRFADGECPVVFWDHEADEQQRPEQIAANFLEWMEGEMGS